MSHNRSKNFILWNFSATGSCITTILPEEVCELEATDSECDDPELLTATTCTCDTGYEQQELGCIGVKSVMYTDTVIRKSIHPQRACALLCCGILLLRKLCLHFECQIRSLDTNLTLKMEACILATECLSIATVRIALLYAHFFAIQMSMNVKTDRVTKTGSAPTQQGVLSVSVKQASQELVWNVMV